MPKSFLLQGIDGNSLLQGVTSDDRMLKFGLGGKYMGEAVVSYRISRSREMDLVSLINVENNLEAAFLFDRTFSKYAVYADINTIIKQLTLHPNLIFVGKRHCTFEDAKGSIDYAQYFYGFTYGAVSQKSIMEVLRVDG